MKARTVKKLLLAMVGGGALFFGATLSAQYADNNFLAPALSSGAAEILRLSQAKVSDDTIIAYIKSGGKTFYLNADQILLLRQQGVSEAVITAMLSLPSASMEASTATPETTPAASSESTPPATTEPSTDYTQTGPYYSMDNAPYYPYYYYYYPAYGYYNWSYPFYWPYCWGGFWHGNPCSWHGGFCGRNGHNFIVHHNGVVSHGTFTVHQGNGAVVHGN